MGITSLCEAVDVWGARRICVIGYVLQADLRDVANTN